MKTFKIKKIVCMLCAVLCLCSFKLYTIANENKYDKTKYDDIYIYHYATSGFYGKDADGNSIYEQHYYNLDSETEVVAYEFYDDDDFGIGFVSKSKCIGYYSSEIYAQRYSINLVEQRKTQFVDTYMGGNIKLFDSREHALAYLETGSIDGLKRGADVDYDSDNIYFKSFDVIVHTSNSVENFYFDFIYEPSDYMQEHKNVAGFNIDVDFLLSVSIGAGISAFDVGKDSVTNYYNELIKDFPDSYRIPFLLKIETGVDWFDKFMNEWQYDVVCGKELILDTNKLEIGDFGASTVLEIDKSYITFTITPYVGDDYGQKYYYNYNFLTGTGQVTSSRVETDGTETSNNDLKTSDGHYHTEASKDAAGNITYNYYYYPANGIPYEISPDDVKNNTGGSGSSSSNVNGSVTINNNITNNIPSNSAQYIAISPVDFNRFVKGMEEMLKQFDKKGGLFLLINDVFDMFPSDVTKVAVGAISAITIASIICILRRH